MRHHRGVNLARQEHLVDLASGWGSFQTDARRRFEGQRLRSVDDPGDAFPRNPILVLQVALGQDRECRLVGVDADALSFQVPWATQRRIAAHEEQRLAE